MASSMIFSHFDDLDVPNRSMVSPWKAVVIVGETSRRQWHGPHPQVIVLIMFVFAIVFDNAVAGALRAPTALP